MWFRTWGVWAAFCTACWCSAEESDMSDHVVERIGLAGCHRQDLPAPSFQRYVAAAPDLMLWIGDNVYTDSPDEMGIIERGHAVLAALPAFQKLRQMAPAAATWDDHDYGLNNFGKRY
jgi:alkaline phosphatase D